MRPAPTEAAIRARIIAAVRQVKADSGSSCTAGELAEKVLAWLAEHDPDLLSEFGEILVERSVRGLAQDEVKTQNRTTVRSKLEAQFAAAVAGEVEAADSFRQTLTVADGATKPIGELTGADHEFVADGYQRSGQRDLLLAAFHRRVARLCGHSTTATAMTEAEYETMRQTILKGDDEWEL